MDRDGKLRHPVYLGLRDDKKPEDIVREPEGRLHSVSKRVPGSKVPGSKVPGSKVPGSRNPEPGTRNPEPERFA